MFLIPLRIIGLILEALGLKKKFVPWGIAYNSVTKQPLDPAYIVLKDLQGKDVTSAITDIDGRYGFLAGPGKYKITANKTNYSFPSQKLTGKANDELYGNLYFGEEIEIKALGEAIIKNIPMDPVKFDWNEFAKRNKNLMKFYSRFDSALRKISGFLFWFGFAVAVVALFAAPYPYNMIIMGLYLILMLLKALGIKPKAYGSIVGKSNDDPLSFAIVRIIIPDLNREIATKVADKYGRYYCLVSKGQYYVKIESKNPDGSYSPVYTSPVIDVSKKGIINRRFKV